MIGLSERMSVMKAKCLNVVGFLLVLSLAALSCGGDKGEPTIEPPTPTPGHKISVTTDKTKYAPGEIISISVTNNLDTRRYGTRNRWNVAFPSGYWRTVTA
jgi:hypothetical protein